MRLPWRSSEAMKPADPVRRAAERERGMNKQVAVVRGRDHYRLTDLVHVPDTSGPAGVLPPDPEQLTAALFSFLYAPDQDFCFTTPRESTSTGLLFSSLIVLLLCANCSLLLSSPSGPASSQGSETCTVSWDMRT
ncbi:unnamed protein product [Pleuronectes platessa]|uniref:Uncharacterized protein n=1 Tax=Pleuronectes platessa TaxID=8262 RepID=A0A9N7YW39_PLEPL|nr:unnamed protein product [Pleuronectes platessa]